MGTLARTPAFANSVGHGHDYLTSQPLSPQLTARLCPAMAIYSLMQLRKIDPVSHCLRRTLRTELSIFQVVHCDHRLNHVVHSSVTTSRSLSGNLEQKG